MTPLTFRRTSDAPPREHEILEIAADGSFALWRSVGEAVGRFAGAAPELDRLEAEVEAALDARPAGTDELPPDASLERIEIGDTTVGFAADRTPAGPWGTLVERLRALMSDLIDHPLAALVLVVDDPAMPRLEHRGTEPLMLQLVQPVAIATVWRNGEHVATVRGAADRIGAEEAGPGWYLDIPVPAVLDEDGDRVVIQVAVDAHHRKQILPIEVYGVADHLDLPLGASSLSALSRRRRRG